MSIGTAGRHLLRSPNPAFRLNSDRRSTAHLQALPNRDRYFKAAFRSPATKTRFRAPITRSMFLAYLFDIHRTFTESAPVRCSGTPRQPALPSRGFYALRDQSVRQFSLPEVHLRKTPDFPSLPAARLHIMKTAADQRSRFATSCEVRCFHEPLGTRTIMRWNLLTVK